MRYLTLVAGFIMGISFVLVLPEFVLWRQVPDVMAQREKTEQRPATLAAEDPCLQARRLFNEAAGLNNAPREKELLEQALALPCEDELTLAYIHNNLGDALERLGQREEALRHYSEAYLRFPYAETIRKNLVRLLEGMDEATARRLTGIGRVQKARELIRKLDLPQHRERLRAWRRIAVEWEKPQSPLVPGPDPAMQSTAPASADSETSPPGLSWLPTVILYFDFDSAVLRPESEAQLQELRHALLHPALRENRFRLEGHTCDLGSEAYNQKLSERRALSVKNWLTRNGVPQEQLLVKGYGESRPMVPNTKSSRHLNRRVQVVMVGAKVSLAHYRGTEDGLRQELERLSQLINAEAWQEAEKLLRRLEAMLPPQAPGELRERLEANRILLNLGQGSLE